MWLFTVVLKTEMLVSHYGHYVAYSRVLNFMNMQVLVIAVLLKMIMRRRFSVIQVSSITENYLM